MSLGKTIERLGRRLLVGALSWLLGVRPHPVTLGPSPRILVVRLDERIGNLLMLVPLLDSLRQRFPTATLDLLGSVKGQALLAHHPTLSAYLPFRKRAVFAADGPLWAPWRLRHRRYDLTIDASNPTDPSVTQAILVRLSGAPHTVGADHPGFGRLFTARVFLPDPGAHEIDLRLALLAPVPGTVRSRRVYLGPLPEAASGAVEALCERLRGTPFAVLNVGARLREKMLGAETYAELARLLTAAGLAPVITFGPGEETLAHAVAATAECALAPPTSLWQLAALMARARLVLTCDTGPMHLAVAVGTPTCGLFVATDPARYGYADPPHAAIDARDRAPALWRAEVSQWVQTRTAPPSGP